jgi:REP element-mobilizing transposase RayT
MRVARRVYPGLSYHLTWRFVDRTWFFDSDHQRAKYLHYLGRSLARSDWKCFAFALMSNHIHLACLAGLESLECWAKRVNSPFARWMNKQQGRIGPVIADRPQSKTIAPGHEAYLIAYIHNNPVRAGVVERASDSTWTSHRYYAMTDRPSWLHVDLFDYDPNFESSAESDECARAAFEPDVHAIRTAARRRGAAEVATPLPGGVVPIVGRPFAHMRCDPRDVVDIAADAAGLTTFQLCSHRRSDVIVSARWAAVHCGLRAGLCASDMAAALGISPAAASKAKERQPSDLARYLLSVAWARLEARLMARTP